MPPLEIDEHDLVSGTQSFNIGPLSLLWPFITQLGIAQIVDAHCPLDPQEEYSHGRVLEAMIACRLCNPVPLYRVEHWARLSGAEHFLQIPADKLNDDRLGRTLEAVFPVRYSIQACVATRLMARFDVPLRRLHFDPTHFLFHGQYEDQRDGPDLLRVRAGRHARTNKGAQEAQVGLNMAYDEAGTIPIFYVTGDGNDNSATLAVRNLEKLHRHLEPKRLLLVEDRGCFSTEHAFRIHDQGFSFIAAQNWSASLREVLQRVPAGEFAESAFRSIAQQSLRRTGRRPERQEHYRVAERPMTWTHPGDGRTMEVRMVFVYSSADDKATKAARAKYTEQIRTGLETLRRQVDNGRQRDPSVITARVLKLLGRKSAAKYFEWSLTALSASEQAALAPPGTGRRYRTHRLEFRYREELAREDARWDGYWALATNVPRAEMATDHVFCAYKEQYHMDVAQHQMKGPLRIHPVFLRTQERIESLVLVVFLALMIFYLLQREYRRRTGPKDRTTAETVLGKFVNVCLLVQGMRLRVAAPDREQSRVLRLLELPDVGEQICANRRRKAGPGCRGAPP